MEKKEIKPTYSVQFFDEEHGWLFTYPLSSYDSKEESDTIVSKLAEIFPKYRFRTKEDKNEN